METIIGLEQDEDRRYTLATVPRSYEPIIWALEKEVESERFMLSGPTGPVGDVATKAANALGGTAC